MQKYKLGDIVKPKYGGLEQCTKQVNSGLSGSINSIPNSRVEGPIIAIHHSLDATVWYELAGYGNSFNADALELVKASKEYKFKEGDTVQVVEGGRYFFDPEDPYATTSNFHTKNSSRFGTTNTVKDRKQAQGLNWYRLNLGGNWYTEEGLKETFPEKWSIKGGPDFEAFLKECKEIGGSNTGNATSYYDFDGKELKWNYVRHHIPKFEEVTVERLRNHYSKKQTVNMEEKKQIIGYKFKPGMEEYESVAAVIGRKGNVVAFNDIPTYKNQKYIPMIGCKSTIDNLKEAGVLDLWFEPAYQEAFKVGDWVFDNLGQIFRIEEIDGCLALGKTPQGNKYSETLRGLRRMATADEVSKASEILLTLKASNKTLEVRIKEKGYFHVEGRKLSIGLLKNLTKAVSDLGGWSVTPTQYNIGCALGISIEQIQKVIKAENDFYEI